MFGLFKKQKKYSSIKASEFNKVVKNNDSVIIDVRSESEQKSGKIPGSILVNVSRPDFAQKVSNMDKNKSYYLYCRSGFRSAKACGIMYDLGFEKVYNLSGGIMAWNRSK
ncbi:MAG: rhodanese-like domain-containing protein [Cytophagales bacterium]